MNASRSDQPEPGRDRMSVERTSARDLRVTRTVDAPRSAVFDAWTDAERFRRWWVPESFGLTLLACELDARQGGTYRLVFKHPAAPEPMAFHGRYLDVIPGSRLVWTNEEAGEAGQVTTVNFEEVNGRTRIVVDERYPSREALDAEMAAGSLSWNDETFDQLEDLLRPVPAHA